MSETEKQLGISCPDGGQFYICEDDDTQFVGCCVNDPCGANNGTCPEGDLRTTTFNPDRYNDIFQQDCNNSQSVRNWYTCTGTNPPFIGCCSLNACNTGCPRARLEPAMLSKTERNRLEFLDPRNRGSTTASTASETASSTASSTAEASKDEGLGTGATAGIAVAATVGGLISLILIAWLFWWKPRQKKKHQQGFNPAYNAPPAPPVSEQTYSPSGGPIHHGTFTSQSPMSGYQHSWTPTPTVMNQHLMGASPMDQSQKYSPHTSQTERPQSYAQFSDHGNHNSPSLPPYQQAHSQYHMSHVSEMDGTTTVPQEMSAGEEHHTQRRYSTTPNNQGQGLNIAT
ncbi:hypothetical protein NW762_008640 [Fusarium torreyae]|uniref:Uncharacterized protein n=1 Tax=Fusarium torreyae TaxID=1237075 RepID=A0A9W8VC33_9HYPO|nr:hypothetical protein NW762_008640 [Fusarium torreyae]